MAAPPPPYAPAVAVDDDEDDGFDWEAAVREIDSACSLASASTAAISNPAPPPPPRQPSAYPPSGPAPAPSAAAPFFHGPSAGGARQSTLDRFVDSFTKRQAAKEWPPPAPVVPVAAAVPPASRGGRFTARPDEGCSRSAGGEEIAEGACAVALDHEAVQTWIYPTNIEVREYQLYIVQKALFTNTLVALPTGLGKTFIAAVVMYNYFRWFPEGKIVFTAPSRPLVTQQIEACHNTVGIPQLVASHVPLRILALTATPGSKHPDIQGVINNLCISELVHRDESDPEVRRYVNARTVDLVKVPVGSDTFQVNEKLLEIIRPYIVQLRAAGVIDNREAANWSSHQLHILREKFNQAPPPNIPIEKKNEIRRSFAAAFSLCRISKLLLSHGIKPAYQAIEASLNEGAWNMFSRNEAFARAKEMMRSFLNKGVSSPKVQKLVEVLIDHFQKNNPKDSRVIIFSHYRESVKEILGALGGSCTNFFRPAQFIGQSSAGQELQGYKKKQGSTRTMKNLLRKQDNFDFHASPRMVPHIYKPEVKYVKLSIEKYVRCLKKRKVDDSCASPIMNKMSVEDDQLIARYFSACKEDIWKPSLVAFPSFQVSPCDIYKVPHSFRTTDMLIDAMQRLQDLSFSRTKCGTPLREPADVAALKDQPLEGHYYPTGQVACSKSVCVTSSPVKTYPLHSFFCGDYVAVDIKGYVSITFVPAVPRTSGFHKDTQNVNWQYKVQNKMAPYKLTTDVSGPRTDGAYSSKLIFADNASNLDPHSPDYSEQYDPGRHVPFCTTPSKSFSSPTEKWGTPCNTKLASPALLVQEDTELSPRLTHYIEEGIVPESPVLEVSHQKLETDRASDVCFVPKVGYSKAHTQGNGPGCHDGSLSFGEKGQFPAGVTEVLGLTRDNVLDQTQVEAEEPSNVKICSPAARTPTANLLCDSLSDDWQVKSVAGDTSGSVQQAPKYRRLCKYGEKIKRVPSMSLNDRYDGYGGRQCDVTNKSMPNQMGHARGNKGKAKRRLDIYIDEQAEVSEDTYISADEDDDQSKDKYEDSFIDDQATPSGQFTQSEQGGEHTGDRMAFYRWSLLTQSTVVLPSRYQDLSDNSVSIAGSASCSSGNSHNPIETPQGILQKHGTTGPSPLGPQQSSLERASLTKEHGQASVVNCESTSKPDSIKRKLSFQQAASIPIINLDLEPAPPSSHLATEVGNDYWDDAFFEGLDLDAIEAQATEQLRLQKAQSQKPAETKRASDVSFMPPSFDLGF
ncbi:hypothetical protein ACQ4PT_058168 [Festuca glaucescens]